MGHTAGLDVSGTRNGEAFSTSGIKSRTGQSLEMLTQREKMNTEREIKGRTENKNRLMGMEKV